MHGKTLGHLTAMFTVILWGTTFISTKVLLTGFQPVEILFIRFVLGLAALTAACPKRIKGTTWRQELTAAADKWATSAYLPSCFPLYFCGTLMYNKDSKTCFSAGGAARTDLKRRRFF